MHAKLSYLVQRKMNGSEKEFVHASDNVLKVLILFIVFFMTQITFSIYMSRRYRLYENE